VVHDARIPRYSRPIAVEDDKAGDESSYFVSPLVTPRGIALSDSEKAEALADNLEAQFQPLTFPSVPAVTEKVDVALRSYLISPASEPKIQTLSRFRKPSEVSRSARLRARTVSRTGP